jgi:hypothetical protein
MQTQHSVFIRKFGSLAIVITVTDWEVFKQLEKHSEHDSPDFIISGITSTGTIYTNMNMEMILSTRGEVKDITDETKGLSLMGIMLGTSPAGPLWAYRKIDGLSAVTEMITTKIED